MISKITSISLVLALSLVLVACNQPATQAPTNNDTVRTLATDTSTPADNMEAFSASYSDYQVDEAQGQKHVLFFHADWCPTCVKWDGKLKDEVSGLPDNALVIKVDYDTAGDLIEQYGVTKHSTAVFINADGSVAKRELDPSLESLTAFFQN